MSQILNLASLPVVAIYVPHLDTLREVTGAEGWQSIFTTAVEPIFGVHIVTSPLYCPCRITPFCGFAFIQEGSP
jgi:hypothetical protein